LVLAFTIDNPHRKFRPSFFVYPNFCPQHFFSSIYILCHVEISRQTEKLGCLSSNDRRTIIFQRRKGVEIVHG
jgi:hypothetical protein